VSNLKKNYKNLLVKTNINTLQQQRRLDLRREYNNKNYKNNNKNYKNNNKNYKNNNKNYKNNNKNYNTTTTTINRK